MQGVIRCVTGSNPYFLVIYMDSLNSLELEKQESLTPVAGSRALLQHAVCAGCGEAFFKGRTVQLPWMAQGN